MRDGRIVTMPAKRSRRLVLLNHVAQLFWSTRASSTATTGCTGEPAARWTLSKLSAVRQ